MALVGNSVRAGALSPVSFHLMQNQLVQAFHVVSRIVLVKFSFPNPAILTLASLHHSPSSSTPDFRLLLLLGGRLESVPMRVSLRKLFAVRPILRRASPQTSAEASSLPHRDFQPQQHPHPFSVKVAHGSLQTPGPSSLTRPACCLAPALRATGSCLTLSTSLRPAEMGYEMA
ncbi:hypothetical protein LZ32DRAFT_609482 [Colletotrichum eremochloae]|nr:hypothetical protein LZ32DRAFT_609482 [Colletotrichum eremochloae]